ncbi:MAG: TraB/GumN family protein [Parvularculaceae bacterium]
MRTSQIYLFGTVHILPADMVWSTPAFEQAMAETSITMTEADVASPNAQERLASLIQQHGYNAPGVTLSQTLGSAQRATGEHCSCLWRSDVGY